MHILQRWMDLLNTRAGTTHLLNSGLPDFTQIGMDCNSTMMTLQVGPSTRCNSCSRRCMCLSTRLFLQGTAFFYSQARNAERIATILNVSTYASEMSALADAIVAAFQAFFIQTNSQGDVVVGDGSLDVTTWALYLGLVPQAQQVGVHEFCEVTASALTPRLCFSEPSCGIHQRTHR